METESFYWIQSPWPGRLAIVPRPRGGDWLKEEVDDWVREGLQVVVSLLTPDEAAELELTNEAEMFRSKGLEFYSFPIPDFGVPASRAETLKLVKELDSHLRAGRSVGIHCRQARGRSPLIAACLLVSAGEAPDKAFDQIAEARGFPVPETTEQREWVETFAPELAASTFERRR